MTIVLWSFLAAFQAAAAPPQAAAPPERVEIVLFSDFQCPFCAQAAQPFRELQKNGVDGVAVTVTFKHFPLSIHPLARLAHQAALAAAEQGKFWEMHDLLFANQRRAQREDFIEFAKRLGLNLARFSNDLDSDRAKAIIAADMAEAARARVNGTPTYTINGVQYSGTRSLDQLKQLIGGEQARSRALAEITDDLMSRGPAGAPVTVELFADLQSPVSRPAINVLNDVMQRYPSAVHLQFRNFPLSFHPQAALAHEAAMIAAKEGHFWEFVSYLLDHQDSLREQDLIALAGRLGIDQARFAETLRQRRYAPRVDADLKAGLQKGIRGSPVILVNGRRIDGVPSLQALVDHVEAELAARKTTESRKP